MTENASQFANEIGDYGDVFNSDKFDKDSIGLALSGGGYKAAAYHLGALVRLNQLGYLTRIRRISSVSGGSITAGYLGSRWKELTFDAKGIATNFDTIIVEPLREFLTEVNLDITQGVLGLLSPFRSGSDGVAHGYDKHLFKGATLQSLPDDTAAPQFMLVATNYELNSLWRFSKRYAADYRVGRIQEPRFSLARIVAASSAFPPFFCPLELDISGHTLEALPGADRNTGDFKRRALLADGGIYDNMGLEPIWKRFGTLLVSNAGDPFDEDKHPGDWFQLMLRIISMMHRQAENNRQRQLMILSNLGQRKIAYWPLRNQTSNYPQPSAKSPSEADVKAAQEEGVRLWSLGSKAFNRLGNHGYSMCDSAMRSYLEPGASPVASLPF